MRFCQLFVRLVAVSGVVVLSACSGGAAGPTAKESEIGAVAKTQVTTFVDNAKKQPTAAAAELKVLMESLDGYADSQSGQFKTVRDTAKELVAAYGPPVDQAKVTSLLDKLTQEAAKLP